MSSPAAPIHFACTNCGAHLSVDGSTQTPTCAYCKTEMLLPEAIWRRFHPAPEPSAPESPVAGAGIRSSLVVALVVALVAILGVCLAVAGLLAGKTGITVTSGPPNPIASPGEPCIGRRAACSKDGKAELLCGASDAMAVAQTCKGPNACRAATDGKSVTCDTTLAELSDPCNVNDDACSTDHKVELRCQAGKFAVVATCKGPDGCTLTPLKTGSGYTLSCDDHVADVGDPCFDTERTACSSDKKALLTCTAQRFVVHRACKRGCTVKKLVGTANKEMDCE
jgi:hypothetical protein